GVRRRSEFADARARTLPHRLRRARHLLLRRRRQTGIPARRALRRDRHAVLLGLLRGRRAHPAARATHAPSRAQRVLGGRRFFPRRRTLPPVLAAPRVMAAVSRLRCTHRHTSAALVRSAAVASRTGVAAARRTALRSGLVAKLCPRAPPRAHRSIRVAGDVARIGPRPPVPRTGDVRQPRARRWTANHCSGLRSCELTAPAAPPRCPRWYRATSSPRLWA